jgi:hypothetical protein
MRRLYPLHGSYLSAHEAVRALLEEIRTRDNVSVERLRAAREQLCKIPHSSFRDYLYQIIERASRFRELKAEADAPLDTAAADARLDSEVDEADWLLAEAEVFNQESPIHTSTSSAGGKSFKSVRVCSI